MKIKSSNNITDKTMIPKKGIRNYGSFLFSRTGNNDKCSAVTLLYFIHPTKKQVLTCFEQCFIKVPKKTTDISLIIARNGTLKLQKFSSKA
jgi:hypothetical protein